MEKVLSIVLMTLLSLAKHVAVTETVLSLPPQHIFTPTSNRPYDSFSLQGNNNPSSVPFVIRLPSDQPLAQPTAPITPPFYQPFQVPFFEPQPHYLQNQQIRQNQIPAPSNGLTVPTETVWNADNDPKLYYYVESNKKEILTKQHPKKIDKEVFEKLVKIKQEEVKNKLLVNEKNKQGKKKENAKTNSNKKHKKNTHKNYQSTTQTPKTQHKTVKKDTKTNKKAKVESTLAKPIKQATITDSAPLNSDVITLGPIVALPQHEVTEYIEEDIPNSEINEYDSESTKTIKNSDYKSPTKSNYPDSDSYKKLKSGGHGLSGSLKSSLGIPVSKAGDGERIVFHMAGHAGPMSYKWGYDTGKGSNRQFRFEERDQEGVVKGRYGYYDKHGKLNVVNYNAHPESGFHAEPVEVGPDGEP